MATDKKLYLTWSEKKAELPGYEFPDDDEKEINLEKLRSSGWNRTEDQIFIFVMTVALM